MRHFAPLLLLSSLVAQTPTPKVPTFHLPAGEYPVLQLLQQAELAVRAPIRSKDAGDLTTAAPIRLQCDLALPEQAWEDVLGALLATRDLVLVRDAESKGHEVLAVPNGPTDWVQERALPMSLQQLFERPAYAGPVRLVVVSTTSSNLMTNMLRPYFALSKEAFSLVAVDGGLQLVGLADTVRFATATIASVAPDVASALPARATPPWPRVASTTVHRLEPGAHTTVQIVDRLAKALRRNIVVAPAIATAATPIAVAEAIEGNDDSFEDQLTSLLWTAHVLVLQVSGPHGLYQAVRAEPRSWPTSSRAQELSAAELMARPALVAWVTSTPAPGSLSQPEMLGVVRAAMGAGAPSSLTAGTTNDGGMRLTGLSTDVAKVLLGLEQKKAAK